MENKWSIRKIPNSTKWSVVCRSGFIAIYTVNSFEEAVDLIWA